ncbi:hypothetical protein EG835_03190 [bacterium]|nr:hypothetical protein [bacterium]
MPLALRRAGVVLVLAALFAAVPCFAYARKTVGLSSGSFLFTVDPGSSGSGEVIVTAQHQS